MKRSCCRILWIAVLLVGCTPKLPPTAALYPAKQGEKWGYISEDGRWRINPQFEEADRFSEGLARVKGSGHEGFINREGDWIVQPVYFKVSAFSEGLARVVPVWKTDADSLVQVVAGVPSSQPVRRTPARFINHEGKTVFSLPPDASEADDFHEGFASVSTPYQSVYGFMDKNGNVVTRAYSNKSFYFSEGLAVKSGEERPPFGKFYGFGDSKGVFVIPPTFEAAEAFSNGLAAVKINGLWGFIDHSGQMAVPAGFNAVQPFSDDRAAVQDGADWFYIDKTGKRMAVGPFDRLSRFTSSVAVAHGLFGWRIVHADGHMNELPNGVEPTEPTMGFIDGLLQAQKEGKIVYLRPDGSYAFEPQ